MRARTIAVAVTQGMLLVTVFETRARGQSPRQDPCPGRILCPGTQDECQEEPDDCRAHMTKAKAACRAKGIPCDGKRVDFGELEKLITDRVSNLPGTSNDAPQEPVKSPSNWPAAPQEIRLPSGEVFMGHKVENREGPEAGMVGYGKGTKLPNGVVVLENGTRVFPDGDVIPPVPGMRKLNHVEKAEQLQRINAITEKLEKLTPKPTDAQRKRWRDYYRKPIHQPPR